MIDLYKYNDKICQTIILSVEGKPKEEMMQFFSCMYKV